MATVKPITSPLTTRMPPTGGKLNGQNQPISTTQPAITAKNGRK